MIKELQKQFEKQESISLPIIADFVKKSKKSKKSKNIIITKILFVNSDFYQTSQMKCYTFNKPLYLINDK